MAELAPHLCCMATVLLRIGADMRVTTTRFIFGALLALALATGVRAQTPAAPMQPPPPERSDILTDSVPRDVQMHQLRHAVARLPVAALLASVLALRPRRRATPRRQLSVVQTQIILAIVGAVVMLVVGASLARAFGIVGAAGLVRYRAKIDDPKDAGVMLSTLAVGLAAGVGSWMLATFGTVFILLVLWIIESFEPLPTQVFTLKIKAKEPARLKPQVEALLTRYRLAHDLRSASDDEIHYEVRVPVDQKTDRMSKIITKLDPETTSVEFEEKKEKK
jgi:hypothetical protein